MKRLFAMILCLALLLGCAAAETAEKTQMGRIGVEKAFDLQCALPEGYEINIYEMESGRVFAMVIPEDEDHSKPIMSLSIAYDELLQDVERLNDISEEGLAQIEETFRIEDEVEISYTETAYGTKLMVVKEVQDGIDYVDFYTIYKGYQIEFVLSSYGVSNGVPLTEEQIEMAVKFLSDLDFLPAE